MTVGLVITTKDYANWKISSVEAIEIYDYQSGELITKYDDKNSIDKLITILDIENWEKVGKINDDISSKYTIKLYHDTTKQDKNDDIEEITIYGDGEYASIFSISPGGVKQNYKTNIDISKLIGR